MKIKKELLVICLIICLFSIASVAAGDVNQTVVASENDEVMSVENGQDSSTVDHLDATDELNIETADEPEASAVQKNFTDIQNLIDAADDGDTINLTGNYINLDKKYIELNKSITLDGKGQTILDGNSEVLFNISKPNVKLINIKFVNVEGNANGSINWQGDYGSIENCTFMNVNFTVILWQGNHGSLVDCEFEKSYKALQIIHWMGNYSSIRSCRFKNMDTYGQYAGTIAMWGNNSLISNCSFTNSTSNRYGGAICLMGDNGTVESSEFINCYSSYGGAITVGTPYSTVDNCSFQDCSSHNMGGAVYWAGGYGNLTNSEFQNCSCYSSGGAVTWQAIDGNIINCTFNECSANNQGGTIYWGYNNGRVENCKFSNLYSRTTTSAIQWFGAYGVLRNSTFINCSSSEYLLGAGVVFTYGHFHLMENCSFINCSSDYAYGVAYISGDFSKVDDCSFINCHCKDLGGALRCDDSVVSNSRFIDCYSNTGGSVYAIDSNVTGCYFENSHAVNGGAICAIGNYIFINISDCQFVNTTAVKGGAISVFKANCNLSACSFVNSTAENGGAVYLADSNVSANKLLFSNVCCQNFGDLIYTESYLDIRNSVLQPIDLVGDRHVIYANNTDIKACENWWGGNENPSNLVNFDAFHTHDLSQWIVTDELKLNDGEISIDFNHLMNDDGNMTEFAADLPAFEIEASAVNGSFAKDKTLVKNGIATFTFNQNGERDVLTFACNSAKWYFAIGQKYNVPTRLSAVRYYSPDNNLILFNISLYDEEDNLISDSVIVSLNGNRNHVTLSNGSAEAISMNNTDEDYLILIRYEGNWKYLPSELMFSKDNPFVAIEATQSSHNEKLVVTVNVIEGLNGTVNLKVSDKNFSSVIEQGKAIFTIPNLDAGLHNCIITYFGNKLYQGVENYTTFTVKKANASVYYFDCKIRPYTSFTIYGDDDLSGNLWLILGGRNLTMEHYKNGAYSYTANDFELGSYNATLIYEGDKNYYPFNKNITVNFVKSKCYISISMEKSEYGQITYVDYGKPVNISVEFNYDLTTGEFVFDLNGNASKHNVSDSRPFRITYTDLMPGFYNCTVNFLGNYYYNPGESTKLFIVKKLNQTADFNVSVNDIAFGSDAVVDVDVNGSGNMTLTILNQTFFGENKNGKVRFTIPDLDAGSYEISVTYLGNETHMNLTKKATFNVNKIKTELTAGEITAVYNINKNLVITLKDSNGNALSGVKINVNLNGDKTYTSDKNGQIKVPTKGLAPKIYTARVTFTGNLNCEKSTMNVKVTVKKATPKLTAKKKTFKKAVKIKKYTITLKDNTGKAIKKAKLTLKIKGKAFTAKTNSKGKATFKIKKLTKNGTYKSTVTYKGNKYYNKVTKKVKIKIR